MKLYPFQEAGVAALAASERFYLMDEMGLGKTVQAIHAVGALGGTQKVLVGCPASVVDNWRREIKRSEVDAAFFVMSYASEPPAGEWDVVILDEAHYLKNRGALRTKRWLGVTAAHVWALSGTPTPNHPGELHTIARAFFPEKLRALRVFSGAAWLDRFTRWSMTKYGPRPYAAQNTEMLRAFLAPWTLRRTLEGVDLEMPPLRVDTHLLPKDKRVDEAFDRLGLEMDAEALLVLTQTPRVRSQVAALRHYLGLYKAPYIGEQIAAELRDHAYPKVVVFAYHLDVLAVLRSVLEPFGLVHVDGSIQASARQVAVDKFTRDPRVRVFLGQQAAAGIGQNLQAAHEVVLVEPDWSPEVNRQYLKRIHRIGQTRSCRARLFAVRGTLDEGLMALLARKAQMIQETLG